MCQVWGNGTVTGATHRRNGRSFSARTEIATGAAGIASGRTRIDSGLTEIASKEGLGGLGVSRLGGLGVLRLGGLRVLRLGEASQGVGWMMARFGKNTSTSCRYVYDDDDANEFTPNITPNASPHHHSSRAAAAHTGKVTPLQ